MGPKSTFLFLSDLAPTFLSNLAVKNEDDVDAVLAAYRRQELAAFSDFNGELEQRKALVQHGIVILKDAYYLDHHPWGDRHRIITRQNYHQKYQISKTRPTLRKYIHSRLNQPPPNVVITYVDSACASYPSASEKLRAQDPKDVLLRGKKRKRANVIIGPTAGEALDGDLPSVFTQDNHPIRDESSSLDAESTSLLFADGGQIKRRKTSYESNSTLCLGREKLVQTGPIAKSMDALALQTNMVIEALALQTHRARDEIWKDLREWLDCVIGLRYNSSTLCGDVRGEVFQMTSKDLDGKDAHDCSEPNEFVRLRQSSPPTAGGDLSQARGYKVSNGGQSKVSDYGPQTTTLISHKALSSSDSSLPLMLPINPSVPGGELSTSLAQAGHQATATWTIPEPSPYSVFTVSNGAGSQLQTTTLILPETRDSDNASEGHTHAEADETLDASNGRAHLDGEQQACIEGTWEDRNSSRDTSTAEQHSVEGDFNQPHSSTTTEFAPIPPSKPVILSNLFSSTIPQPEVNHIFDTGNTSCHNSYTPIQSCQLVGDGAGFSTAYLNLNEPVYYCSEFSSIQSGSFVDVSASYSYTSIQSCQSVGDGAGFSTAYHEPVYHPSSSVQSGSVVDVCASCSYTPIQSRQWVGDGAGFSTAHYEPVYHPSSSVQSGSLVDASASCSYTPIQSRQSVGDGAGFSTAYHEPVYHSFTSVPFGPFVDVGASYSSTPNHSHPLLNDAGYDFAQLG